MRTHIKLEKIGRRFATLLLAWSLLCLPAVGWSAASASKSNAIGQFVDFVAGTVYKAAWPTADYRGAYLEKISLSADGFDFQIILHGKSGMDGTRLWLRLLVQLKSDGIQSKIISHNAQWANPFETTRAIASLLSQLDSEYARRSTTQPTSRISSYMCSGTVQVLTPGLDGSEVSNYIEPLKAGAKLSPITQYVVYSPRGVGAFCVKGDHCYARYIQVNGRRVEAVKLDNCFVDSTPTREADGDYFGLYLDPARNSEADMKEALLRNALEDAGLCVACAGNASYKYSREPDSMCGQLVAQALAGESIAVRRLNAEQSICR